MLRTLEVKNFAVIDELRLDFSDGLSVFTGETGAGKSILIEALGFLLGARGSASWVRAGASKLEVAGYFDREDFSAEMRAQFKISDSPVTVRREFDAAGKTRAMINAQSASLATLAAWGETLVDFHGQHEHQALLKPAIQLECLDRFGGQEKELAAVADLHARWTALRAESDSTQLSEEERFKRIDWARFQLQEIVEADPKPDEEEHLEAALPMLKNAERVRGLASAAYELLYEQEGSIQGNILKVERALSELARIDAAMKPSQQSVEAARIALEEVTHALGDYRDHVELNPERLDAILSRLDALSRLKKKYGPTAAGVLACRARLESELKSLENSAERAELIEGELNDAEQALARACESLHRGRTKAARKLEEALLRELKGLGMPAVRFSILVEMEEGRYARTGADAVEFLIAANPGEPLKPVRSVASGGELSRVMLALKTALAKADRVRVLVFDEVDAGIGGVVARTVGEKLAGLGASRQVLCVTHLAQVACFGQGHFHVAKHVEGGRTKTRVERLDKDGRLEMIALMLGGRDATAASRKHAKELLAASSAS